MKQFDFQYGRHGFWLPETINFFSRLTLHPVTIPCTRLTWTLIGRDKILLTQNSCMVQTLDHFKSILIWLSWFSIHNWNKINFFKNGYMSNHNTMSYVWYMYSHHRLIARHRINIFSKTVLLNSGEQSGLEILYKMNNFHNAETSDIDNVFLLYCRLI